MATRSKSVTKDRSGIPQPSWSSAAKKLASLSLAMLVALAARSVAQNVPPLVATSQVVLASSTYPPPVNGNALLQGAGFGTLAVDKLGDVFVGAYNSNAVYEFPASGAAPIPVYLSSTGGHAGAVALDPNENLVVSERFNDFIYLIPYVNGVYTPYSYSSSSTPPACKTNPTAPCNYDTDLLTYQNSLKSAVTGYYYQPMALAFDSQGNSYIATAYDNSGSNNIYECTVACNYAGANNAALLYHNSTYVDSIAVDGSGDVFFADSSPSVYELKAGAKTPIVVADSFIQAQGVALDQNGNLYVSDLGTAADNAHAGVYIVPMENGSLKSADAFMVLPLIYSSPNTGYDSPQNIGVIGIAVDQHGNIFENLAYNGLSKFTINNASLAATALGKTSAATTLTIVFNKAAALKSTSVTAAGAASSEFAVVSSGKTAGTCVTGTEYKSGENCTLVVTFSPAKPGLRTAILSLVDGDGDSVPVYLSGIGLGQAITVDPATQTTIGSDIKSPQSVAVDAAGNVFVADAASNSVYEFHGGTGSGTALGSGLRQPGGVAVDAGGNLYISDTGNDRVVMIPTSDGALDPSAQSTVLSDVKAPGQLAVEADGTLFIPETGNDDVLAFISRAGLGSSPMTTTQLSGLKSPSAVATDAFGSLYIADTGHNAVVKFSDGASSNVGSSLSSPAGVALDASGSVLIADQGNGRIVRVPLEKGVLTTSDQVTINTSIASPHSVQVDATGNIYATDDTNGVVDFLNRTSGAIDFGRVNGGSTSVEETMVLTSSGPADLTLGKPLYPPPPTGTPFLVTSPASGGCSGMALLSAGSTCTLDTVFAPSKALEGEQKYVLDFNTSAQNSSSASLLLTGDTVNLTIPAVSLVKTQPTGGTIDYGTSITVEATVSRVTGVFGTPTGTVIFIVDGANGQPQTLNDSGLASLTLKGLSGGSHTIAVSYSGDNHYAPGASKALTIVIAPDSSATTLSMVGYAVNPLTIEPPNPTNTGDSVTMTATVVPSIPGALSGPVVFSGANKILGTATVTGTTVGSTTVYTAVLTTNTIPEGTYPVIATFMGNSNYISSASQPTQLIVTPPKFVLAQSASGISSSQNAPGSSTISVTSYAGFTGGVDFSCSGLPAHATCQFVPAVLSLTATGAVPINVPVLTTTLNVLVDQAPVVTPTGIFWWSGILLGLSLYGLAGNRRARRRLWMQCAAAVLVLSSLAGISACGGSAAFVTPSGTSTVTINAVASPTGASTGVSNVSQSMQFTLTVK
jgi:trimeric autotransporter adhesin